MDSSKPVESKTAETCKLAERWEGGSPPVPAGAVNIAKKVLENEVSVHYVLYASYLIIAVGV